MSIVVICALLFAFVVYITIGLSLARGTKGIADMLPLGFDRQARVKNSAEFSASTVATTISLATVVIAFFELAQSLGLWLFWTVITTAAGLLVVRLFAARIWHRLCAYDHRPTLHEFLGREYDSRVLSYVGAVCTSLGFLGAFAVELTVGSRLFAALVPDVPSWIVVVVLSLVAFTYTAIGGFRAVIVTDRVQMLSIWLLLLALPVFYIVYVTAHGGWAAGYAKIPDGIIHIGCPPTLMTFIIGIFIINVMTYISDMSIWQRIAGARQTKTVTEGLWSSVLLSAATWSMLVILACFVFMIITPQKGLNPLFVLLQTIDRTPGVLSVVVLFFVCLGLYGAMLSTASTQLIAVSHTLYEDVFCRLRKHPLAERLLMTRELGVSRAILVIAAVFSTILVHLLSRQFSIAEMVFAIYGAQVGLCPLVVAALLLPREKLKGISAWAAVAVSGGFIAGWEAALLGGYTENTNLVFLAPVFSLAVSSLFLAIGMLLRTTEAKYQQ
jgi:Na+/proline symporter